MFKKWLFLAVYFLFCSFYGRSQNIDLMLQGWYWDYFTGANYGTWINQINSKATELQTAGFKHIWLPPLSRSSTSNNYSNGYNPMDLYDLGQYGPSCAWGTRTQLNTLISNFNTKGLNVVSDMIYNHRDGGKPEKNDAVKYFITNTANTVVYPSDRVFYALPLGTANPGNNGAGDYYFKVRSKSYGYNTNGYKFYGRTASTSYQGTLTEMEPNGGLNCGPAIPSQPYTLGYDLLAYLGPDVNGCHVDEIKITLDGTNFNATDDTLFIYMNNTSGGYSDHYIYGIWSAARNQDIVNELQYFTYTNFNGLPSGQGGMNYNAFRPNDNTANAGGVTEDFSWPMNTPLFFYDYDQSQSAAKDALNAWTLWEMQSVGIKGLRMDAVKHFQPEFVGQLLNYLNANGQNPSMVVGEFFDYNPYVLNDWINSVYANMNGTASGAIKVKAFDFSLRGALKDACDNSRAINPGSPYDVRNVFSAGIVDGAGGSGFNSVVFVDNHDVRQEGNGIQNDARLAYAYILTNNQVGSPCVFYPDYFGGQVGNTPNINLKAEIDKLVSLHKTYIYGSNERKYLSKYLSGYGQYFVPGVNADYDELLVYQIKPNGTGKDVIVAINFSANPVDMYQVIHTGWGSGAGTTFTDMLGYSGGVTTNITPSNEIHVTLPARSYTVYVEGVNAPLPLDLLDFNAEKRGNLAHLNWSTTTEKNVQYFEIERASDLNGQFESKGRVEAINSELTQNYEFDDALPESGSEVYYRLRMVDNDGSTRYSPLRKLTLDEKSWTASITPNPGIFAELSVNSPKKRTLQVEIHALNGQQVAKTILECSSGETLYTLPSESMPPGTYIIQITEGQVKQFIQWIKK